MNMKGIITACMLLVSIVTNAQWEIDIGAGPAFPITGYGEVVKTGWLLDMGAQRRVTNKFAIGIKANFTRLQNDDNTNDTFQNARLTIAPILFTAEYTITDKGRFQPYLTAGLGISMYSFNYDVSPTEGKSEFNVSFTMMPLAGLRYKATSRIYPFIETSFVLLADGPPPGFPQSSLMTGYQSIVGGIQYRFK